MADGIVWNLASKALESLGKSTVQKAASWWGARDDLKKLENSMWMIQARVRDAERRQEDASSETIKLWLQRLRQVLYRADDLFDEVLTLDLQKQQTESSTLAKVGIVFSKSGPLYYNRRLAKEIKSIRKELDAIKSDMADLNLSVLVADELQHPINRMMKKRETSSFVNTEDVIGRHHDRNMIIEMLFDPKYDGEKITVIPIVGFGGLGKTTLAQLVFNHERVIKHFDLTKWAYVPEIDNPIVMMGKVFKSFTNKNYDDQTLDQIQQGIRGSIKSKKYLLVLDDLWDERADRLIDLVSLLKCGNQGSKVIVTTRSDKIAKVVGTIGEPHKLGTLTHDQSWKMFKKLAFKPGQEDKNPALSTIGEEIVQTCGNVPLAIKVVGGFLRSKDTEEEWSQVRDTQRSRAQQTEGDNVMAALKLSYDYLTPVLKQCFAYCSLFPKGYEFDKNDLVHLWMAQGYVQPDRGDQFFSDLVARNLFQVSDNGGRLYKMHDLLHDLAQDVAGDESMMLGYERPGQTCDRLVHVNLNRSKCPPSLKDANRLRSLLNFKSNATDDKSFSEFQSLRALSMYFDKDKKLPNPIGRLIHLRYLKFGPIKCEYLPGSITRLVNLQTLNLESCDQLKELPRDFAKLANLKHLLLPYNMTDLSPGFGKLTSLQELNRFIVGKGNGIDSLGAWNHKGELDIKFFRWRRDAIQEVKRANMKNHHQLTSLTLDLKFEEEESTPAAGNMNEMLRCLQLPPNLKYLEVWGYKGDEMPVRWLDGLSQLVFIEISGCKKCKVLPNLSWLPHLKFLELFRLDVLEYVEDEDNIGVGTATHNRCFFRSLEVLKLRICNKLKGWMRASKDDSERRQLVFPCLLKMVVDECPMLMSMPLAPKLESLDVCLINWKMVESNLRSNHDEEVPSSSSAPPSSSTLFTSLKELHIREVDDELISLSISSSLCNLSILRIRDCSELRNLRFESPNSIRELLSERCSRLKSISEGLQHLSVLEKLEINDCGELEMEEEEEQEEGKSSRGWEGLSSLRLLELRRIPKVKTLPRGIACVTTLQELRVYDMENLTEIPEEIGNLSLLRHLCIQKCPKLKSLPTSIQGLASLQTLIIDSCPDLAKKSMPDGEDWHLIQHLPNLSIQDGSKLYQRSNGVEVHYR